MKIFFIGFFFTFVINVDQALGSEAGMPQLNPEFWPSQIFWLILIFSSLYLIIWKIFLPKITYSIENRKSKIVNDLNETQKLKEKAEKKLSEYKKIIENSNKEAKKIIEDNRKRLDRDIEIKKNKFHEDIDKELQVVEKEIINLKQSSLLNISKIATEITSEVMKQIIDAEVNNSNVSAIVNDIAKKKMDKQI
jgi:F-type H+-transporting ATPase subunit b